MKVTAHYLRGKADYADELGYRDHANLLRDAANTIEVLQSAATPSIEIAREALAAEKARLVPSEMTPRDTIAQTKIGSLAHVIAEMLERAGEQRPNGDILHDILAQVLPAAGYTIVADMEKAVEAGAAAVDPEIWAIDAPISTRADIEALHARRRKSVEIAKKVLTAASPHMPVPAGHRHKDVGVGMAIAASIVMRCWGDIVIAGEILGAAGFDAAEDLREAGVDQYDIDLVLPALKTAAAPLASQPKGGA